MTDRKKKLNQYKKNISLHVTDISYNEFQPWSSKCLVFSSGQFDHQDLEIYAERKNFARKIVMVALRHKVQISNSKIVRNAYSLISKMDTDPDVKMDQKSKARVDNTNYKISY